MAMNPQVEVIWTNIKSLSQVRLRGKAVLVEDEAVQMRFKDANPKVVQLFLPGAEHLFRLYKIKPEKVEATKGLVPYEEVTW